MSKTTGSSCCHLLNLRTTMFPKNPLRCLHSTPTTVLTHASFQRSKSKQSMRPQPLRTLLCTCIKFTIVLLKMSSMPKIIKLDTTIPNINQSNLNSAIWFGSTLRTSQRLDPPRSSIGNVSVHSGLSSALDYKPTSWTCLLRCATSMIHSIFRFWIQLN